MEGKILYWTNFIYQYQPKYLKLSDYKMYIQELNTETKNNDYKTNLINNEIFHVNSIKEITKDNNTFTLIINDEIKFDFKVDNSEVCDLWINMIKLNKANYENLFDDMYKKEINNFDFDFFYKLKILKELEICLDKLKMDDDLKEFLLMQHKHIENLNTYYKELENLDYKINLSNPIEFKLHNRIKEILMLINDFKVII